jgi:hypothetical protein
MNVNIFYNIPDQFYKNDFDLTQKCDVNKNGGVKWIRSPLAFFHL